MMNENKIVNDTKELFNDEHIKKLEKEFIQKYNGNEKHPIKVIMVNLFYQLYFF